MHHHQKGTLDNSNDHDIADEIEIEVFIEGCVDCGSSIRTKKRIAIGGRTYDRAGRLRVLAVTTSTRFESLPDIPTVDEFQTS
jgi:hypothetical protein